MVDKDNALDHLADLLGREWQLLESSRGVRNMEELAQVSAHESTVCGLTQQIFVPALHPGVGERELVLRAQVDGRLLHLQQCDCLLRFVLRVCEIVRERDGRDERVEVC